MDRQLYNLVEKLISIQAELGQVAYCRAAAAAYQAIARVALAEAESQAQDEAKAHAHAKVDLLACEQRLQLIPDLRIGATKVGQLRVAAGIVKWSCC